jgi:broad specificity phosphatase PhoE
MRLFIVRHGQTAWNAAKVFRGRKNIPLSPTGLHQAELVAGRLTREGIRRVISSPLDRARQTATPLATRLGLETEIDERLIDICYGAWEGRPDEEIRAEFPDLYARWTTRPAKVRFPGGETLEEVARRTMPAVEEYVAAGLDAALFTHRVVVKVLLLCLSDLSVDGFWNERVGTAGISLYQSGGVDEGFAFKNDTAHLASLGLTEADF